MSGVKAGHKLGALGLEPGNLLRQKDFPRHQNYKTGPCGPCQPTRTANACPVSRVLHVLLDGRFYGLFQKFLLTTKPFKFPAKKSPHIPLDFRTRNFPTCRRQVSVFLRQNFPDDLARMIPLINDLIQNAGV